MSFSSEVKLELIQQPAGEACCATAGLAGMLLVAGSLTFRGAGRYGLSLNTESAAIARYFYSEIKRWFGVRVEIRAAHRAQLGGLMSYQLMFPEEAVDEVLDRCALRDRRRALGLVQGIPGKLVARECCRRAMLRALFLGGGTLSSPEKGYHLEFSCADQPLAQAIQRLLNNYQLGAKIVSRKAQFVVYLKDSERIADLLGLLGAHQALFRLEDVRILKGMRNSVNRLVNFETANVDKTVNAAERQVESILLIAQREGLDSLPAPLREIAELRLEYREATLVELGDLLSPPLGKSGVNSRLRKLDAIAEELRRERGGKDPHEEERCT